MQPDKKAQIGKIRKSNDSSKRGQIGETMTWIIATIVIIVILAISIFIASVSTSRLKRVNQEFFQTADILASKSMYSYLSTKDSEGKTIYEQLKGEGNLNEFNGNFALKIFRGLYEKDYLANPNNIWLGIVVETEKKANGESCGNEPQFCVLESMENKFFGGMPQGDRNTEIGYHFVPFTSEKVQLENKKRIELNLIGK
jgi:hypothetical protein